MLHPGWLSASRVRLALFAALLILAGAEAQTGAETRRKSETRDQALTRLRSPDAATRQAAAAVLAETGEQEDLPYILSHLFDPDQRMRASAEAAIWAIWSRSGDAAADQMFEVGLTHMREGQLKPAVDAFSRVIALRPDFAEAWNKRATVYFLLGENDLSLLDCHEVLKRNPLHFGVLAGYGQLYLRKGDLPGALNSFEQALAINPNMDGVRASISAIREILNRRDGRFI